MARKTKIKKPAISGITGIRVSGFKSIDKEQHIEIRPLTVLAGANSSGKSSMMQPLLLLKQTLEARYDPGSLLLNGEHVRFARTTDFLSRNRRSEISGEFSIEIHHDDGMRTGVVFADRGKTGLDIEQMTLLRDGKVHTIHDNMTQPEIVDFVMPQGLDSDHELAALYRGFTEPTGRSASSPTWRVDRTGCFFDFVLAPPDGSSELRVSPAGRVSYHILRVIHLLGLRGRPERTYPRTAVGDRFLGLFGNYVASIVSEWQKNGDKRLRQLARALRELGLTSRIRAEYVDETQVRLEVGRLPGRSKRGEEDLVSIADVGVGVSQVVPVLVALIAAKTGQLVYVEQPEIHLHPRAQTALAEIIAEAAKRGVIVVIETHSPLLILALQSLVAEGKLDPKLAKLHWFRRIRGGSTRVSSADLDDAGAFGDWPEDFADVTLEIQQRYIEAAFSRMPH